MDGREDFPLVDAITPGALGSASLTPTGQFVAGSYQTFTLVYRAGPHGIDDSGSLRICFRFATDIGRPQFDEPAAPNYTTVVASNGAHLEYRFDYKGNVRPWDRTLYIKVVDGFLSEGDTITVCFGARDGSSPGIRLQTFCEESFEFRVLVDPIATFNYAPLPEQPSIAIVPGEPVRWLATLPTLWPAGEPFALHVKGEDRWGNPSDRCALTLALRCPGLAGAPPTLSLAPGDRAVRLEGLRIERPGDYRIELLDSAGALVCVSNPIRIAEGPWRHAWADLHGQSEETIGTNSAADFFRFARDLAPVDVAGHQGNDFQITEGFWRELDRHTAAFDAPGRFVTLPGYEWSGNTGLGGDRNVYFPSEGRTLRRSSRALVADRDHPETDCRHVRQLYAALAEAGEMDVVMFAHCGGRYADLSIGHDGRFERSVEIHSSWGTFDWILHDAFALGARLGIVANSDGHKGRPGASYPGTSLFGAIGGLTCLLVEELSRPAVLDCLRKRHHYATSGGASARLLLEVTADLPPGSRIFHDDPKVFPQSQGSVGATAMMGDIVQVAGESVELRVAVTAPGPIESVELFDGPTLLETLRPAPASARSRRLRLLWSGARYRGRFRQVVWDGAAKVDGNRILGAAPVNFFNPEKPVELAGDGTVSWRSLTTGNSAGVDLLLAEPSAGRLAVRAGPIEFELPLRALRGDDQVFEVPGPLPRRLTVRRLAERNDCSSFGFSRRIAVAAGRDTPLYLRIHLEDGTLAWSSPIYLFR